MKFAISSVAVVAVSFLSRDIIVSVLFLPFAEATTGVRNENGAIRHRKLNHDYGTLSPTLSPFPMSDDYEGGDDDNGGSGDYYGKKVSACFPEMATIEVLNKGTIYMKDLELGDHVVTGNLKNPYQLVYSFGHFEAEESMEYYQISTTGNSVQRPLMISKEHLLYVQSKAGPVRADSVRVGDVLRAKHQTSVTVTNIDKVMKKGMYAPLTADGAIIVNGIIASAYIGISEKSDEFVEVGGVVLPLTQADGIHLWLSPLRLFCMGVNSKPCESLNENGINHFVQFGMDFGNWVEQQCGLVQSVIFIMALSVTSLLYCAEYLFGASYGLMMIVFGTGFLALLRNGMRDIRLRVTRETKDKVE